MQPDTRYAKSGDVRIAYQVVGSGPFDLVCVPGFISRLASFSRLVLFDKQALDCQTGPAMLRRWRSAWTMCAR